MMFFCSLFTLTQSNAIGRNEEVSQGYLLGLAMGMILVDFHIWEIVFF